MALMHKLKVVSVLNTVEAVGIGPGENVDSLDVDNILEIWGNDSIYPKPEPYKILPTKMAERAASILEAASVSVATSGSSRSELRRLNRKRKADQQDHWVTGSTAVAARAAPSPAAIDGHRYLKK
jgi:hypothetical protein